MFGYIRPYMPALTEMQRTEYRSVYCGLCLTLGRRYGHPYRFVLSYDIVYLSMLHRQCTGLSCDTRTVRCPYNPLHKTQAAVEDESLLYAACVFVIMFYHKLRDEISDSGWLKGLGWRFLSLFFRRGYRRACRHMPAFSDTVSHEMGRQLALEQRGETSVDAACDPTARILSQAFADISGSAPVMRHLQRLGFLLGRFVYIADAAADLREDAKRRGYNPYLLRERIEYLSDTAYESLIAQCELSLNATLYGVCEAYEALGFSPNAVVDNITMLGLEHMKTAILHGEERHRWTLTKS